MLCGLAAGAHRRPAFALPPVVADEPGDGAYDTTAPRHRRRVRPAAAIVIVDVDERSLSAIGQWPWRRDVIGRLVVAPARARRVRRWRSTSSSRKPIATTAGGDADAALAETLRRRPRRPRLRDDVRSAAHQAQRRACSTRSASPSSGAATKRRGSVLSARPARSAVCRCCRGRRRVRVPERRARSRRPAAARAAAAWSIDGRVYPASALAAVTAATGARDVGAPRRQRERLVADARRAAARAARRQEQSAAALSRPQAHVSVRVGRRRAERQRAAPETFADKIVFVGTTALGTREVVATPLDTLFAGVEVQATVADNLLQQRLHPTGPSTASRSRRRSSLGLGIVAALLVRPPRPRLGRRRQSRRRCAAVWVRRVVLLSAQRHVPLAALSDDRPDARRSRR